MFRRAPPEKSFSYKFRIPFQSAAAAAAKLTKLAAEKDTMASTAAASPFEKRTVAPTQIETRTSGASRWLVPSFADLIFVLLMYILAFSPTGLRLFNDGDTGWHIRTGEQILRTWTVPRVDSFSYTMAGRPWYAWEWLYDALLAAIHSKTGLVGVRVLTAVVIALTFALLYKLLARRTGNALMAALLTVLAAAAAQVHMLARPHIVSWLFTVLFTTVLYGFQEGRRRQLLWLPLLTLLWANSHGAFVLGPALVAMFSAAEAWQMASARSDEARRRRRRNLHWLLAVGAGCVAATLITPYGYKLHLHVAEYLRNSYIMNHNAEFQSPDFHLLADRFFEVLLLLTLGTVAIAKRKLSAVDVLLVLTGTHLALYSVRNVPIGAILLPAAVGPAMAALVEDNGERKNIPDVVRQAARRLRATSERMTVVQQQLRGHVAAVAVLTIACAAAWNGGRIAGQQTITAGFSEKRFPVKATEKLATLDVHQGVFAPDMWGGYLIYKLYPSFRVFGDDRHDFYGERFLREFVDTANAKPGWEQTLARNRLDWVLMPPGAALSAVLRQDPAWQVVHADATAVLFERR